MSLSLCPILSLLWLLPNTNLQKHRGTSWPIFAWKSIIKTIRMLKFLKLLLTRNQAFELCFQLGQRESSEIQPLSRARRLLRELLSTEWGLGTYFLRIKDLDLNYHLSTLVNCEEGCLVALCSWRGKWKGRERSCP